ncbi:hypothetical protein I5M32_13295 [Pedobacter sp. SD-b]|uniref:Polysaccharide lyase 14 domain-containing protein n=1 Tax=Pedobacter segetis TaxID=2793069 RepID=A0ABS1BM28_9SPHI|nr:hypothetical protein [Pedobacter segetis]MBK0383938.1 hypothetical protein [Pedobacter segetis]
MTAICLLGMLGVVSSCKKEVKEPSIEQQPNGSDKVLKALGSGDWINFTTSGNKEYTSALAAGNFGPIVKNSGFDTGRAQIINHELKVTMLAHKLTGDGGVIGNFDIPDGPSYEVTYRVKFPSGFIWGGNDKGGKLGFGFGIGDGNTGGDKSDGNGGSVRLMWIKLSNGKAVFKPYIYHTNMPDSYGDDLGLDYGYSPNDQGLNTNTYYTIKIRVRSNTNADNISSHNNGELMMSVDGHTFLSRNNMNFAWKSGKKWIRELLFQTFRGGKEDSWKTGTDTYIYYDDIKFTKDPTGTF